jgi:hypothetical protein
MSRRKIQERNSQDMEGFLKPSWGNRDKKLSHTNAFPIRPNKIHCPLSSDRNFLIYRPFPEGLAAGAVHLVSAHPDMSFSLTDTQSRRELLEPILERYRTSYGQGYRNRFPDF